jgi:hypothetical protein
MSKVLTSTCYVCTNEYLGADHDEVDVLMADKQSRIIFYRCEPCLKRHGKTLRIVSTKLSGKAVTWGYFENKPLDGVDLPPLSEKILQSLR